MARRRSTDTRGVTVYNSEPFPVMVDQQGRMIAGSSMGSVDPADPITAQLIERGTLITQEAE